MSQPARVLEQADVRRLLHHVRHHHRHPLRDRTLVLLSVKAGLRAVEMAGLAWPMVLTPSGGIGDLVQVTSAIAKNGRARRLPLHPQLAAALGQLHVVCGRPVVGPVIVSERGTAMTAASVVNWFGRLYANAGLAGCSSHSGRRTFITRSARLLARAGGSLRDVQELAGHRHLTTTERYIEGDRDAQRRLVSLV